MGWGMCKTKCVKNYFSCTNRRMGSSFPGMEKTFGWDVFSEEIAQGLLRFSQAVNGTVNAMLKR